MSAGRSTVSLRMNRSITTEIFSVSANLLVSGDLSLRVPFTCSVYLSPKTIQSLSISKIISIHTHTIQYIVSCGYYYSVHPDIGWMGARRTAAPDTATVCTLI